MQPGAALGGALNRVAAMSTPWCEVGFRLTGRWAEVLSYRREHGDAMMYAMGKFADLVLGASLLALAGCSTETGADGGTSSDACPGAINWRDASSVEGGQAVVQGPVVSASYQADVTGQPTFLNLGADYPDHSRFTVVIWGQDRADFPTPPEVLFDGMTLCVSGEVYEYEGAPQIRVDDPSQLSTLP